MIGKDTADNRAPTVSFTVHGVDPAVIAEKLAEQNIGIANGNCYAYRLMEALDIPLTKASCVCHLYITRAQKKLVD